LLDLPNYDKFSAHFGTTLLLQNSFFLLDFLGLWSNFVGKNYKSEHTFNLVKLLKFIIGKSEFLFCGNL
jgi:hypothetical protein